MNYLLKWEILEKNVLKENWTMFQVSTLINQTLNKFEVKRHSNFIRKKGKKWRSNKILKAYMSKGQNLTFTVKYKQNIQNNILLIKHLPQFVIQPEICTYDYWEHGHLHG